MDQLSYILYNTNEVRVDQQLIDNLANSPYKKMAKDKKIDDPLPHSCSNTSAVGKQDLLLLLNQRVKKLQEKQNERKTHYERTILSLVNQIDKTSQLSKDQREQIKILNEELFEAKRMLKSVTGLAEISAMPTTITKDSRQFSSLTHLPSKM